MKRIVALILLMELSVVSFAGNSSAVDLGNKYYKEFDFKKAVVCYLKALKKEKKNISLLQHVADCYRLMNDWISAKPYYAKLVTGNRVKPQNYRYYAEALRESKDYDNAKIYFGKYLEVFPEDSSVKLQLSMIDKTPELLLGNNIYEITNMKDINTPFSEFGVSFFGLNDIYFCSNRKPDNFVKRTDSWTNNSFLKIYTAEVTDSLGTLKNVTMLPSTKVNKKYHEGVPCYNEKIDELYFDRSNYDGNKAFYSADRTVKLKIYKVSWLPDASKWDGELEEAVPFNSREYSVCHPSLNKKADTLYFTSDMPGGYGRSDIYLSAKMHDGQWGAPVNLGPGINTSGDDMFPFIAEDGTLYFASNGHVGLGGLDIFSTRCVKGIWSTPVNLGAPINSNLDDFGYVIRRDNSHGYFCSNRPGGQGDDDIYSFKRTGIRVNGVAYNGTTGDSIGGVQISVKPNVSPAIMSTEGNGTFSFSAQPDFDYSFVATKPGYSDAKLTYHVSDSSAVVRIPMFAVNSDNSLLVSVTDKKTHMPLDNVLVKIVKSTDSVPVVRYTDKDGKVSFALDTNSKYKMDVYKETGDPNEKYLRVTADVTTKDHFPSTATKTEFELDKLKRIVDIRLENIYYDLDKSDIRPDAAKELDKLVKIMMDNPTMIIELSSHTDCRSSADYNLALSKLRAMSAMEYIISKGIARYRITSQGYGESKLLNKCQCEGTYEVPCTEEQHQFNRRTEFKILKF